MRLLVSDECTTAHCTLHCTHRCIAQWIGDEYTSASLCISDRRLRRLCCLRVSTVIPSGGVSGPCVRWQKLRRREWWRIWRMERGKVEAPAGERRRRPQRQRCERSTSSSETSRRPPLHVNVSPSESPNDPPIVTRCDTHVDVKPSKTGKRISY